MLRRVLDLPLLVILMGIGALMMNLPAAHAVVLGEYRVGRAFFYSALILMVLTAMIAIATQTYHPRNVARSHLAALVGAYLVLPVLLAVPVVQAVPDTSFWNAWFEMVSSFTTTGATVYDTPGRLPPSVHLWRGLVGWFGGFFILLSAMAVLAPMNLGGVEVLTGRVPGRGAQGASQITRIAEPSERLARHAVLLFPVYAALTLALWVGLLMAGDDSLTALVHAMSTLSTSGISAGTGIVDTQSGILGEVLVLVFLLPAVTRRALPFTVTGLAEKAGRFRDDPELRLAGVILAAVTAALFLRHWIGAFEVQDAGDGAAALRALWGTLFTALSFLTTTGFESSEWMTARSWSGLGTPGLVLVGLAIIGGGVATTAGGVKLLRVYALYRHGERELERLIHPSSIGGSGQQARRIRREGAYVAWVFFMLFALSIAAIVLALSLVGIPFEPALVLTIAALTTTGQLAVVAAEAPMAWVTLGPEAKAILGAAMIVGRLETLAILALLTPDVWRR